MVPTESEPMNQYYDWMRSHASETVALKEDFYAVLRGDIVYLESDNQLATWAGRMAVLGPMCAQFVLDLLDDGRPF